MTESEWNSSTDPVRMLDFLVKSRPGGGTARYGNEAIATERKSRLFACACCRAVWPQMTDERSRRAVEVAERYADGEATEGELRHAADEAQEVYYTEHDGGTPAVSDAISCAHSDVAIAASQIADTPHALPPATQAALLRDIFGNPFRPVQTEFSAKEWGVWNDIEPWFRRLLEWSDGTCEKIAQAIYDGREPCPQCEGDGGYEPNGMVDCPDCDGTGQRETGFRADLMPILADALEEAGCDNEDILAHCRGRERCGKCYGKGYLKTPGSVWGPTMPCKDVATDLYPSGIGCDGTGWRPQGCSHVRGCWVIDLILGKE